jgi:hypothetical protein
MSCHGFFLVGYKEFGSLLIIDCIPAPLTLSENILMTSTQRIIQKNYSEDFRRIIQINQGIIFHLKAG